jgi:drug/metabolite transporter (DMT)-like permease
MGVVYAILASVCLGISSIFFKESTQALGPSNTTLFYYLFGSLFAFILWASLGGRQSFARGDLIWPALTALSLSTSVIFFTTSLKSTRVSVVTTIYGLSFVVTVVLAVLLKKDVLHLKDYIASGLAVAAVIVFSM